MVRDRNPWTRRLRWLGLALIALALLLHFGWPYVETARADSIAARLAGRYGLVVRFGDPAEFQLPPSSPEIGSFRIERADPRHVRKALAGVEAALSGYPPELVQRFLTGVFVTGVLELEGVRGSGSFADSWIYVSATPDSDRPGSQFYAETVHHELSSLFFFGANFPAADWAKANPPEFRYLANRTDVIRAAVQRADPDHAQSWYQAGFVSDYGMSSLENDFNTYAELALAQPDRLKRLAGRYQRIAEKTRILVAFYAELSPEMGKKLAPLGQ